MVGSPRTNHFATVWVLLATVAPISGCLEHRSAPEAYASDCSGCHGDPKRNDIGTDNAVNVLQRAAPPYDVQGRTLSGSRSVGAHVAHISKTSTHASVVCASCHPGVDPAVAQDSVSIYYYTLSHIDGKTPLVFSDIAATPGASPTWNGRTCANVYCHNPVSASQPTTGASMPEPEWTSSGQVVCGGCHGLPPPAPHPTVTGGCSTCHTNTTDNLGFVDATKHINGTVDF